MPLQQTVGNLPLQNMDENEASVSNPEFEGMKGDEFLQQMDQKNEVAQSEQITNGGDDTGEEGHLLHPPIN